MTLLASELTGKTIDKWKVIEKRVKTLTDDSGAFSSCYRVLNIKDNSYAFLKALNYHYAFSATGTKSSVPAMRRITSEFDYEKSILDLCADRRMKRVVRAIDSGEYREPGEPYPVESYTPRRE